jgi:hypothetical protein
MDITVEHVYTDICPHQWEEDRGQAAPVDLTFRANDCRTQHVAQSKSLIESFSKFKLMYGIRTLSGRRVCTEYAAWSLKGKKHLSTNKSTMRRTDSTTLTGCILALQLHTRSRSEAWLTFASKKRGKV